MFVRLFVDENLDRIVPISKQPKEKIQAIIDSCTRQFPEFAERARKRIRTYLKSCRRNKRSRETNGAWDAVRIVRIKTETASLNSRILTYRSHPVSLRSSETLNALLHQETHSSLYCNIYI
jgi:hypothetical protein